MPELNPAEQASQDALQSLYQAIDQNQSFLFEAGAGSGKTYSLIKALKYLIEKKGSTLVRSHMRIACLTYTNVAKDEINSRTDKHPAVHSDTIHAFSWSLIKRYQNELRKLLPTIGKWSEILTNYYQTLVDIQNEGQQAEEVVPVIEFQTLIGKKNVIYDLGFASINQNEILLSHNDVIDLIVELLNYDKFRAIMISLYPVIFIDEYQDTNKGFATALQEHFINKEVGPLIGFFGDHWQKIYNDVCGKIDNDKLIFIPKNANFRSMANVVNMLNHMRPQLQQQITDPESTGRIVVFHTNNWQGDRRTGAHWGGDLPADIARQYLTFAKCELMQNGWTLEPSETKILMLTHNLLADEQGYKELAAIFKYNDAFVKKEDKYISFLVDFIEPLCISYEDSKFGEMFSILGNAKIAITSHEDKLTWKDFMTDLSEIRQNGTIGDLLDFVKEQKPKLVSEKVALAEAKFNEYQPEDGIEEPNDIKKIREIRSVRYTEITALAKFVNDHSPFATNHSVKGEEYKNVLVVVGRGWNLYNIDQMLSWSLNGIPDGRTETFERSRNLFYVACSRAIENLAVLFTQQLSDGGLEQLGNWFGADNIIALDDNVPILN